MSLQNNAWIPTKKKKKEKEKMYNSSAGCVIKLWQTTISCSNIKNIKERDVN